MSEEAMGRKVVERSSMREEIGWAKGGEKPSIHPKTKYPSNK
jgi:hypothetical protein